MIDAVTESVSSASGDWVGRWVWVRELSLRVIWSVTDPVLVRVTLRVSFSVPQERVRVEGVSDQDNVRVKVCGAVTCRVAVLGLADNETVRESMTAGEGVADTEGVERVPVDVGVRVQVAERDMAGGAERVSVGSPVAVAVAVAHLLEVGVRSSEGLRDWVRDGDAEEVEVPVLVLAYVADKEGVCVGNVPDFCRVQEGVAKWLPVSLRLAVAVLVAVRVTRTPVEVGVGVPLGPLEVAVGCRRGLPVPDRLLVPTPEGVVVAV